MIMKNLFVIAFLLIATSCSNDPITINYGKDSCDFCKMTIMDEKFSSQCISKKGKAFKFDDVHCLISFIKNGGVWSNEIAKIYFSDFANKGKWVEPEQALILKSEELKSPMGGNYAVFSNEQQREEAFKQYNGEKITWEKIKPVK
jgi:copper chaperone NosL